MEGKQVSPRCKPNDLLSHKSGIFLWCLPIAAMIVVSSWPSVRTWLWIPAFLVMGIGCLVNARRCGRLHCYLTGPLFILAAIYAALAAANVLPIHLGTFLGAILTIALLACLAEVPLGRYRKGKHRTFVQDS